MRIFLIILFVSFDIFIFGQSKSNFKIHGVVKDGYAYKMLLRYTKDDASSIGINAEDIAIVQNNEFTFQGFINEPVQAYLVLDGNPFRAPIYLDTSNIEIEITINSVGDIMHPKAKIDINSIKGSWSDNAQSEFYAGARKIMTADESEVIKSQNLFESILTFVKKYPSHNLSSEFLESAYPLSYSQAKIIYDHLSKHQMDKASRNGVAEFLNRAQKLQSGYVFAPQPDTLGNLISGKELTYKYMLVHFWASYARQENASLVELYKNYNKMGLEILGISIDEKRSEWIKAIKYDGLAWPQVSDLKGVNNAVYKYYTIPYVPFDFVIDHTGKVIFSGFHGDMLRQKIENLFH